MSLDNQNTSSIGDSDSPPTKPKGKWVLGGFGCLGLLVLIGVVGVVWWFNANEFNQVREEAKGFVESSTVMQQHLGSPIIVDGEKYSSDQEGGVIQFDVSGPLGGGTVAVPLQKDDANPGNYIISEGTLKFNGQEINLNQEDELSIDIEGMDDF